MFDQIKGGASPMGRLGTSVMGTIVSLFIVALAAAAVAVGWRFGNTRSPI